MVMEEQSTSCCNHSEILTHQIPHSIGCIQKPTKVAAVRRNISTNKKLKDSAFHNDAQASSSSSSASTFPNPSKRKHPKVCIAATTRRTGCVNCSNIGTAALPLGMSLAAFVAQVIEKNKASGEHLTTDELSAICASAVRESLHNVFGRKYDTFSRNFQMSFCSTLRTLRMINDFSQKGESSTSTVNDEAEREDSIRCIDDELGSETNQIVQCMSSTLAVTNNHLSTVEQCIVEQTRSNDLKALEIGLTMRKLKLKEAQLALTYDSNHLERSKLAMGVSKASFKAEKFKSQLEESRHGEFLKKVLDCIVASLFIMSSFLSYGAYVFSYQRITEATASCSNVAEGWKSWWMPKQMTSFNSGWQVLKCQARVLSRMVFGMMMIVAIAYLLLQRGGAKQTMPVTFILLLLGVACGIAGKLCVDTLGGSGLFWLLWWELSCLMYFLSVAFASSLFGLLYGSVEVVERKKTLVAFPFWFRRVLYFGLLLLFLPVCCGLLPFARLSDWMDHLLLFGRGFWFPNST